MAQVIKYTDAGGNLHIVHPAPDWGPDLQALISKDVPAGALNIEIVDAAVLPGDRVFRGAWAHTPGSVAIDMAKARDIVREKVQKAADAELPANDAAYVLALQNNDAAGQATTTARAAALRGAPADPAINNAANPAALLVVRPAGLDWTRF